MVRVSIVVIGSLSTDFIVQASRMPEKGETILGTDFKTAFGGKGANQAVAAARLGSEVSFIGAVGGDSFGDKLKNNLRDNDIFCENMETFADSNSGTAHITIYDNDNSIIVVPGTNGMVTPTMINNKTDVILNADYVVIQNEIPLDTTKYIIDFCFENQVKLIYNPAPFVEIEIEYLEKCYMITPNEIESRELFKEDIETVIRKYPNKLIVTLGEKGAVYFDGEKEVRVPAVLTNPVDTTGAGDTFNGALAAFLNKGYSLRTAVEAGNKASSIAIKKIGAQTGIPTLEEWEKADV
ncbi:ribokinase [Corticicoccus populi]|uniref:Ribokinase n=1 Tax=Corticicoccus populi TaxID=1812821 RepID=A0ABW5WYQ1_9STAP